MSTLIDIHTQYGRMPDCACVRAACGGIQSGPDTVSAPCPVDHINWCGRSHVGYDCPALPADTDLSTLWVLVLSGWSATEGWSTISPHRFDRTLISRLRREGVTFDVAEGPGWPEAIAGWRERLSVLRRA
ncbi:hypothetical protein AB0958_18955 [Streptomyces sp. NPDC006655]|uniref:hypothetical protein n=1 Tax=Streptomyces sp. NPDC006655 TaxID=3156898 RepID=UPI003455CA0C